MENTSAEYRYQVLAEAEKLSVLPQNRAKQRKIVRQAGRFMRCGQSYVTTSCIDCKQVYVGPVRCESRICQGCARKYAARIRANQLAIIKRIEDYPGNKLMFLTATMRSTGVFPTTLELRQINRNFRLLVNTLYQKREGAGGFSVMELSPGGMLHIHALIYGKYIPQSTISKTWLAITGDSMIVDVRRAYGVSRCLNYLLKYITKQPQGYDSAQLAKYMAAHIGVRRLHSYGVFYGTGLLRFESCPCYKCKGNMRLIGIGSNLPNCEFVYYSEARQQYG